METFDVDSLSEAQKKVRQNQKQNSKAPGWEPLRNPHRTRILKTDPLSKPCIEAGGRRSTRGGFSCVVFVSLPLEPIDPHFEFVS